MAASKNHRWYEIRVSFKYNDNYHGLGTKPDSFIDSFQAVSWNGAMKTAHTFVAIEEREAHNSGDYYEIDKISVDKCID